MKITKIVLLCCLVFYMVLPVNAIVIPAGGFQSIHSVGAWIAPDSYTGDRSNIFLVAEQANISVWDTTGNSLGMKITGFPADVSGVTSNSDYIYVVLDNGLVYRLENPIGVRTFNSYTLSGDNRDGILLGDVHTATGTYSLRIAIDDSGNVYCWDYTSHDIYRIDSSTFTMSTYFTNGASFATSYGAIGAAHDGLLYGYPTASTTTLADIITNVETNTTIKKLTGLPGATASITGIGELTNDNIIVAWYSSTGTKRFINEYNRSGSYIGSATNDTVQAGYDINNPGNFYIAPNGVIVQVYPVAKYTGIITTYDVPSGAGGYAVLGGGLVPAELTYNEASLYTDYSSYYNSSDVEVHYNLALDLFGQDAPYYADSTASLSNQFNWKAELIDPSGVLVQSYNIPENWVQESFLSGNWYIASSFTLNNVNPNGTYRLNLFEVNVQTNEKSLLDTTTFIVLYESSTSTGTIGTTITNPSDVPTSILNSVYFQAFILIMTCALAGGAVAGGAGLGGGGMIGTVACVMFGLVPYSFAFIIAVICIAIIALAVSDKIGGG